MHRSEDTEQGSRRGGRPAGDYPPVRLSDIADSIDTSTLLEIVYYSREPDFLRAVRAIMALPPAERLRLTCMAEEQTAGAEEGQ